MRHIPVLLQQVLSGLKIVDLATSKSKKRPIFIDCNLGDGGHTEEVIKVLHGNVTAVGFDLDPDAILRATTNIGAMVQKEKSADKSFAEPNLIFINDNFKNLKATLYEATDGDITVDTVDSILFDLGISSYELDESGRGFSFRRDEPLQMTFGSADKHTFNAYDIVNTWEEENIADIIYSYGEDRYARRIAKAIVEARERIAKDGAKTGKQIKTTTELAEIIRSAYPGFARHGKIHPATKTFQALRIAVNDELRAVTTALPQAVELLKAGGRLAVITFHSLEDRIVKRYFKEIIDGGIATGITKKPLIANEAETAENPRSRSAKLRIIEKK